MNDLFLYLAKVSAGLAIVFLPYYLLFRNDPNLVLKRFYLLSGILASWVFPFITFRKLPLTLDLTPTVFIDLDGPVTQPILLEAAETSSHLHINWLQVLMLVYFAGLTGMFLKNLMVIFRWNLTWNRNRNSKGVAFIKTDQVFTLFNRIFIPRSLDKQSDLDQILLHEKAHIRQLHFIDLMLMEGTLLLTWFNPFSWLISRMIKENHEHLADREVLATGVNPARYRAQLMNHTLGVNVFRLGNQFNHSLTLKRFKMMKKPSKSPLGILKIALLIPLVVITLGLTTGHTPQQQTIRGKVMLSDTGKPATGASVIIAGTTTGTVVDEQGQFLLNVDGDPDIVISYVGYETIRTRASKIGSKPLSMKVEVYTMDLESVPMLESKEVTGSVWFRASNGSEASPVFVLDGEVVTEIEDLDPGQIESINVIKDPENPVAKKYNAKDGVVLITTKRGVAVTAPQKVDSFYIVEEMPLFNGGDAGTEFRKYIAKNLRYPEDAAASGISGRVIVQFTVNKNGEVVDPKVVRGVSPSLDQEALRVVKSSPRWTPGKHEGKTVDVMFNFPFNFVAEGPAVENQPSKEIDGEVFYVVEDMPRFPGGTSGLKTYIYSNLDYPDNARKQGIKGEVFIKFLVDTDGRVKDPEILRSSYQGFDEPALKVIREMPDWKPGFQRGKAVKVWHVLSIKFDPETS